MLAHRDRLRWATWGVALGLTAAAFLARRGLLLEAAATTWQPFVTLAGVIAAGVAVDTLGAFRSLARVLVPAAAPDWVAVTGTLALVAVVSGAVNLDVAVVVAVPLALSVARERHWDGGRVAVAVALTANATSFLLPTSNVTTLLILEHAPISPWRYAQTSWLAWLLVTTATVGLLSAQLTHRRRQPGGLGSTAPSPTLGLPAGIRRRALGLLDLLPMFAAATAIRTLLAGGLSLGGGLLTELTQSTLLAAGVNNLPAAAAVSAVGPGGAWAAVLGLAIGPNLVLTGSLASLIARRTARDAGARFAIVEFSALGTAMLPLQLLLAVLGLVVTGASGLHLPGPAG